MDHISVDGVQKAVMICVYDKRLVNGTAFVYHGVLPVPSDSPETKLLFPYIGWKPRLRGHADQRGMRPIPRHLAFELGRQWFHRGPDEDLGREGLLVHVDCSERDRA